MVPAICKKWWKVSLETNSQSLCVSACVPPPVTHLDMHKHTRTIPIWNKQMLGEGRNVHVIFHMAYVFMHARIRNFFLFYSNSAKKETNNLINSKRAQKQVIVRLAAQCMHPATQWLSKIGRYNKLSAKELQKVSYCTRLLPFWQIKLWFEQKSIYPQHTATPPQPSGEINAS